MTVLPSTRFQRAIFWTLWPALALPIAAATLAFWVQPGPADPDGSVYEWVGYSVLGMFLVVLVCSMNLNAWLLLRRPSTLHTRSVPTPTAIALALQYLTIALWIAALFLVPLASGVFTVLAPVTAVESIAVFVLVLSVRRTPPPQVEPEASSPLGRRALIAYAAIATVATAYAITLSAQPNPYDALPYWIPLIVLLGVPWSPAVVGLIVVGVMARFIMGVPWPIDLDTEVRIGTAVLVAPVVLNVAMAVRVLSSARAQEIALRILFWRRRAIS